MKNKILIWVIVGVLLAGAASVGLMYVSYSNQEIQLRNLITAKMADNKSEYDNMWKKISQVAQVTQEERKSLEGIILGNANARSPKSDKQIMTWIKEAVPNVDNKTFINLQNIITASRDSFTMRQKELIDMNREHDNLIMVFPGSIFVGSRGKIEIKVITSTKTEKVFDSGKDDDTKVFN